MNTNETRRIEDTIVDELHTIGISLTALELIRRYGATKETLDAMVEAGILRIENHSNGLSYYSLSYDDIAS